MTLRQLKWTIIDRPGEHDHAPRWRGRCTYCGHRVAWKSPYPNMPHVHVPVTVIETRKQPWRIPSEIVLRYRAMNAVIAVIAEETPAEKRARWIANWEAMIDDEENIQDTEETA